MFAVDLEEGATFANITFMFSFEDVRWFTSTQVSGLLFKLPSLEYSLTQMLQME
jgi:hypothetical protein